MHTKILFDERGIKAGTPFEKGQWREIASHNDIEIKGFFGDYRFLSNFWPARVTLDDVEYSCVENAYQAAKYEESKRDYFKTCTAKEAIVYVREHSIDSASLAVWEEKKVGVMEHLLQQKFDVANNKELHDKLKETGKRFLEETNYWEDTFWGVHKTSKEEVGVGGNMLGKLLMKVRDNS